MPINVLRYQYWSKLPSLIELAGESKNGYHIISQIPYILFILIRMENQGESFDEGGSINELVLYKSADFISCGV